MSEKASAFMAKSIVKASDLDHRRKINFNIAKYNAVVPAGKSQFHDLELARQREKNLKWKSLETPNLQLEAFESTFQKEELRSFGQKTRNKRWKKSGKFVLPR